MDHGICLLVQLLALGLQIQTNKGFEQSQADAIVNENCTRYTTSQYKGLEFTTSTSTKDEGTIRYQI